MADDENSMANGLGAKQKSTVNTIEEELMEDDSMEVELNTTDEEKASSLRLAMTGPNQNLQQQMPTIGVAAIGVVVHGSVGTITSNNQENHLATANELANRQVEAKAAKDNMEAIKIGRENAQKTTSFDQKNAKEQKRQAEIQEEERQVAAAIQDVRQ